MSCFTAVIHLIWVREILRNVKLRFPSNFVRDSFCVSNFIVIWRLAKFLFRPLAAEFNEIRIYIYIYIYIYIHIFFFYSHASVHRDSILIRSNEMQQYAGIYLLQNYCTCFGCLSHPSSEIHQIVTAASGTGHSVSATTFRQRNM